MHVFGVLIKKFSRTISESRSFTGPWYPSQTFLNIVAKSQKVWKFWDNFKSPQTLQFTHRCLQTCPSINEVRCQVKSHVFYYSFVSNPSSTVSEEWLCFSFKLPGLSSDLFRCLLKKTNKLKKKQMQDIPELQQFACVCSKQFSWRSFCNTCGLTCGAHRFYSLNTVSVEHFVDKQTNFRSCHQQIKSCERKLALLCKICQRLHPPSPYFKWQEVYWSRMN